MFAIIPAAGKATRFNGIYKELLPINEEGDTGLSHALKLAKRFGVETAVIVTNWDKNKTHTQYISDTCINTVIHGGEVFKHGVKSEYPKHIFTTIQNPIYHGEDLFGAITAGNISFLQEIFYDNINFEKYTNTSTHCIMLMPDTIPIVSNIPKITKNIDFTLGLFDGKNINRYSVLRWEQYNSRRIITKPNDMHATDRAWGIAIWDRKWARHWIKRSSWYHTQAKSTGNAVYDEAFNDALNLRRYRSFFDIDAYYDIGSWERYVEYIKETQ